MVRPGGGRLEQLHGLGAVLSRGHGVLEPLQQGGRHRPRHQLIVHHQHVDVLWFDRGDRRYVDGIGTVGMIGMVRVWWMHSCRPADRDGTTVRPDVRADVRPESIPTFSLGAHQQDLLDPVLQLRARHPIRHHHGRPEQLSRKRLRVLDHADHTTRPRAPVGLPRDDTRTCIYIRFRHSASFASVDVRSRVRSVRFSFFR
mmetsp:Transcript_13113/g.37864  ORF Transcript_13113/g.37864 Transcript_13113/m.37864 type:complete len:200 (-) Transcript_13113:1690-2289(-)